MNTLQFPESYQRKRVEERLVPGVVIKFPAVMGDGKLHEKRFVVVDGGPPTLTCVMNTEINGFIKSRPDLLKCQVKVSGSYSFADYDCHFDCSQVLSYDRNEVIEVLMGDFNKVLGDVDEPLRDQLVSGLQAAVTVDPDDLATALSSLSAITYP